VESGLADLLGSLAALGRSLGDAFDPQRLLGEFSACVQPLVPLPDQGSENAPLGVFRL
jgi:hypothetical protein